MAIIGKNYYGLSVYGPQDLRAAIWTSEIISPMKPINKINMSLIAKRYEVSIQSLDDSRLTHSGFINGVASGEFTIIFEGCVSRFFYGWLDYETEGIPCSFELYKLTESGYVLTQNDIQYIDYFEKEEQEEDMNNIAYYKIIISGVASPTNKVSLGEIWYSSSAIFVDFKTSAEEDWIGFNKSSVIRENGPATEENPLTWSQESIENHTIQIESATIYQARILLVSANETNPTVKNMEITADFIEPQEEEEKIGVINLSVRIANANLTSIDAIKVFSNNEGSLVESKNIIVTSRTTTNWPIYGYSSNDIWSIPYTKSTERVRLIDRNPGDPPINGAVYGCIISEELADTDVINYEGIRCTTSITEYLPTSRVIQGIPYFQYIPVPYLNTNRAPRIFIEAIQAGAFAGEDIPTTSIDSAIQLNGPIYGRLEIKNTTIVTEEMITSFIRNYKNSSALPFKNLPVPIRIKISFAFYPSISSSPALDRLNCYSNMHFSRVKEISSSSSSMIAYTSHLQSCQYTKNLDGRWWIIPLENLPVGLKEDESYLYMTPKEDEPLDTSSSTKITLSSLGLDDSFPVSLQEYLQENENESVPFKIINRNNITANYLDFRWGISIPELIKIGDITFSSQKNVMNVRDISFSEHPEGAIIVKNSITRENPLIRKYFSGVLMGETSSINTSRLLEDNYISYIMDGITPEDTVEWEPHNVSVDSIAWNYPGWAQDDGQAETRLLRNLRSFNIENAGPRPGDLILWTSEQKIYDGFLNFANNKRDFEIILEDETLPILDEELFNFIEPKEDIPYRVEIVPGSLLTGNKSLPDSEINNLEISIPSENILGRTNYLPRTGSLKVRRGSTLEDELIKENIEEVSLVYYNDNGSIVEYELTTDYSIVENSIVWSASPLNTPPPENAYYFANIKYLELRRLKLLVSSDFCYPDNIVEYFRSPLKIFTAECSNEVPYISPVFDINDFDIPTRGVDLNSLKLVVSDNSEYIRTRIDENRVIGEFEIKDINESWKPLIKNGFYFTNRRQDFYYNNKITRVFNEETVPIITEAVFENDGLLLQPGTENKIINSTFRRSNDLYSLINGITYFEEVEFFNIYKPYYIKRNDYLEISAITDGSEKSGIVFYHTPSSYTIFYLEDNIGILENNRNGRVSLPIRRKEISGAIEYELKVILEQTNIKCFVNDYMIYNVDQGNYLEGFSGFFGSCTDFDIKIKGVDSWNIQSYGDNPIYPVGNKIVFNNLYYSGTDNSYIEQNISCYHDGTIVLTAEGLEVSLDDGILVPSPLNVSDNFEDINIKIYNTTNEKISLEKVQLEEDLATSYTPNSREDSILTIPYNLQEIDIDVDLDILTNNCFILSLGNLEIYKEGNFLRATIEVTSDTSIVEISGRTTLSINQDTTNINILINDELACSIDASNFISDTLLYFGNYLVYDGIFSLYSIRLGEYYYEFKDNLIFNDIDSMGITANLPGSPVSITCNGVKYKRTFFLNEGNYVLNNTIIKKYDRSTIVDLEFKEEEILHIRAYLENGRNLNISSIDNGKIKINGLRESDVGVNIIINYVPKDTYTLNYNEENDNYIISLSNVYGANVLAVYEDIEGEEREIIHNIELNPFKATLNNGFVYLTEQMPPAVSIEYKVTPDFVYKNGKKDCLIVLDIKGSGGTHTDNCLLFINGFSSDEVIKTIYGKIERIKDVERLDQETSGRYFFRYTLISVPTSGILKDVITVIDSISKIGIEIPITIVG